MLIRGKAATITIVRQKTISRCQHREADVIVYCTLISKQPLQKSLKGQLYRFRIYLKKVHQGNIGFK